MTHSTPICPKCAYDQSGEIVIWESQCPLQGRCPECGLGFTWADVFDPSRRELEWNVEHAQSAWQMLCRTPKTLLRLIIPFYYWRSVGVETPIRNRALICWALFVWGGLHLLVSIPYGLGWWKIVDVRNYGSLTELYQLGGMKALIAPFITAIGSPFVYMWVDPNNGTVKVFFELLRGIVLRDALSPMLPIFGMILIWMIILLAVPTTRRQAMIRRAHVVRAGLISMMAAAVVFEFAKLASGLEWYTRVGFTVNINWLQVFLVVVMPALVLWVVVFWASAIRTGWKVRPCGLLIGLGSVASLLGGVVMLYLFWMLMGGEF